MRLLVLALLFLSTASAYSQESSPTPTPDPFSLGGKIGLGMSQINGVTPGISLRYWLSDQTALDAFGAQVLAIDDIFDFGLGVRTNLSKPCKDVLIQGIFQTSYTCTEYVPFIFLGPNSEYDLSAGLGFEAFLPFCEWVSVEDSVLLDYSYRPSPYGTVMGVFLPGSRDATQLTPFNFSIHAYF
jgi:hypothetical protein